MSNEFKPYEAQWPSLAHLCMFSIGQLVRPAGSARAFGEELVIVERSITECGGDSKFVTYKVRPVNRTLHQNVTVYEHDLWPAEWLHERERERMANDIQSFTPTFDPSKPTDFEPPDFSEVAADQLRAPDETLKPEEDPPARWETVAAIRELTSSNNPESIVLAYCSRSNCFGPRGHDGPHRGVTGIAIADADAGRDMDASDEVSPHGCF